MTQQPIKCFTIPLPVIKGQQGGETIYTTQVQFSHLVQMFKFNEDQVPVELRAQRELNPKRAIAIAEYILENREGFTIPAITASVSEEMEFIEAPGYPNLGVLHVPMNALILINDGQHRRSAIEHVLLSAPEMATQTVPVTFYLDKNLEMAQQRFSDINRNQVKPSTSISMLYDLRNPFNEWLISTINKYPKIQRRIEKESNSVGKNSDKLWSLVGFNKFVEYVTGLKDKSFKKASDETKAKAEATLDATLKALESVPMWTPMLDFNVSAITVRDEYIVGHTVFLHAIGKAVATLQGENRSPAELTKLSSIDVAKHADAWKDRCVVGGKMLKNTHGVNSTAAVILEHINAAQDNSEAA